MKKMILVVYAVIAIFGAGGAVGQLVAAAPTPPKGPDMVPVACPNTSVLLYPAWYKGITTCQLDKNSPGLGVQVAITNISDIWIIALNLVQWLIITVGYVALYFVIWGGIKYITSRGDPAKITSAKGAITNAIIGLIIALVSVIIVRAVQGAINGTMT